MYKEVIYLTKSDGKDLDPSEAMVQRVQLLQMACGSWRVVGIRYGTGSSGRSLCGYLGHAKPHVRTLATGAHKSRENLIAIVACYSSGSHISSSNEMTKRMIFLEMLLSARFSKNIRSL
ncbi:hypothetical protein HZH66_006542 [Vespula vulgaris]|uniref:Uncharacterized protein n=1 Tax=Vespula vulgaris TaxID=7454 RepID=A0A834N7K1_VESVU|nr:hypothetical protein HZH66_006542 [Vespula vulgaris]